MEPDISIVPRSASATKARSTLAENEGVRPDRSESHLPEVVATLDVSPAPGPGASLHNGHGRSLRSARANGHGRPPADYATLVPPVADPRQVAPPLGMSVPRLGVVAVRGEGVAEPRVDFYQRLGKRMLDMAGATIGLIFAAPVMLLAAIAIKLESRGPVLYRSTRVGRDGRPFTFYKLRSMVNGADRHRHHLSHLNECDGPVFKISRDPRVTAVGRFLRTTSLDELPQLWNVFRGDMSLVGPRPPLPEEVLHYQPWQMRRLQVRPGITCLWQISGRSRIGFEEWMRMDLEYINRRSFRLDVQILLRTVPAVISREGAY